MRGSPIAAVTLAVASWAAPADAAALLGRAVLPAATFAPGPTSGQFITCSTNGVPVPFVDAQPVQGFSGVIAGPTPGTFDAQE